MTSEDAVSPARITKQDYFRLKAAYEREVIRRKAAERDLEHLRHVVEVVIWDEPPKRFLAPLEEALRVVSNE